MRNRAQSAVFMSYIFFSFMKDRVGINCVSGKSPDRLGFKTRRAGDRKRGCIRHPQFTLWDGALLYTWGDPNSAISLWKPVEVVLEDIPLRLSPTRASSASSTWASLAWICASLPKPSLTLKWQHGHLTRVGRPDPSCPPLLISELFVAYWIIICHNIISITYKR